MNQTIMHEMLSEAYATIFYGSVLTLPALFVFAITVILAVVNRVKYVDGMKVSIRANQLIEECQSALTDNQIDDYEYSTQKYFDQIAA